MRINDSWHGPLGCWIHQSNILRLCFHVPSLPKLYWNNRKSQPKLAPTATVVFNDSASEKLRCNEDMRKGHQVDLLVPLTGFSGLLYASIP
eukprot:4811356-Amphidinium_carterae.1